MTWWVHSMAARGEYVELISWVFWVLFSITLHELAHGWTAIWQGDRTPIEQQRMTLNPIVHMGPHSLIMFALCGIAWGVMPVNPHRFRDGRRGDVYVSAAGPAMNVAIATACVILLTAWLAVGPGNSPLYRNVAVFLSSGAWLNIVLAMLNILPIPPLDGAHILSGLSRTARGILQKPEAAMIGFFIFIAIFFMTPVGNLLWVVARVVTYVAVDALGSMFGNPRVMDVL